MQGRKIGPATSQEAATCEGKGHVESRKEYVCMCVFSEFWFNNLSIHFRMMSMEAAWCFFKEGFTFSFD